MAKRVMLFPGQGAQYPGMGKEFCAAYPEAEEIFQQANEALDFDLRGICFDGPAAEVNRTDVCQPGILTTSIAIITVLERRYDLKRDAFFATAGLSLGEYTAFVFAGVLAFQDALRLVAKRGRFMQEDSDRHPSGMMTLLGASPEQAVQICEACAGENVLVPANYLGPGQIAISGSLEALDRAESKLKEFKIKRGIRLKVAGAFHSKLMEQGGTKLKAALDDVEFNAPKTAVISNVTGDYVSSPDEIRGCLARQVTSPVLWHDSMNRCVGDEVKEFFEPGPGKVLTGIIRKIDKDLSIYNLDDPGEAANFVTGCRSEDP